MNRFNVQFRWLVGGLLAVSACASKPGGTSTTGTTAGVTSTSSGGTAGSSGTTGADTDGGACGGAGQSCCGGSSCNSGLSCQSGVCTQQRTSETGTPCTKNSDCQSGICYPVPGGSPVCTTPCSADGDCLAGWKCAALIGQTSNVCECGKSAETCDGKDNDCDGIIDNEPAADQACQSQIASAEVCQGGACACTKTTCGNTCVDTDVDAQNCGTCGHACTSPESACVGGQCACPNDETFCSATSTCVDTNTDTLNCASCGHACASGATCSGGQCQCPTGQMICGTNCADPTNDSQNCGTCGHACNFTSGEFCTEGQCVSSWANWPMPNPAGSADPQSGAALPNQASYDLSMPGVVVDNVTHLMWQQTVPTQNFDWADAKSYCANLSLAGHDDWRLPTEIELYSLVDFTRNNPSIDPTAFPNTPANFFWSSSPQAVSSSFAWIVGFDYGEAVANGSGGPPYVYPIRCVR